MAVMAVVFYAVIILHILEVVNEGLAYIAWAIYCGFALYGCSVRIQMRTEFGIDGEWLLPSKTPNNMVLLLSVNSELNETGNQVKTQ